VRGWRRGEIHDADRFLILLLAILPANALFAGGYEKDVIMSPAGLFYAAAAYFVFRDLLADTRIPVAPVLVLIVSIGWSVRFIGIHDSLRARALSVQDEWAYYDDWARQQPHDIQLNAEEQAIRQHLYDDAVLRAPRVPQLSLGGVDRVFDFTQ
jgi:hypothetical protein